MLSNWNTSPYDPARYQVADLMTRSVAEVEADVTLAEAAERMWSARIGSLVVLDCKRLLGVITEHDILAASQRRLKPTTPIGEIVTGELVSCSPQTPVADAQALMRSRGVRHLLVLSDGDQVLGIISDTDLRDSLATDMADQRLPVEQLMSSDPPTLPMSADFQSALTKMKDCLSSYVLVVDAEHHPLGMITVRDSVRLFDARHVVPETGLSAVMSSPVLSVRVGSTLEQALRLMRNNRVRHLAVVNSNDILIGVLSESDVVRHVEFAHRHTVERLNLAASVYDHSSEGIIITDPNGVVLDVNAAYERITGYRYDEVVGRKAGEAIRSGEQGPGFYQAMWKSLAENGLWRGEIINRRRNGEPLIEMLTISAVRDSSGTINHYVGVFADITEIRQTKEQIAFLNHYDPLTRLPNRTLFIDRLKTMLGHAQENAQRVAVAYIDLDGFGSLSDRLGNHIGDRILIEIAGRLTKSVRPSDTVARLGSDDFVLLLPDIEHLYDIDRMIGHLLATMGQPLLSAIGETLPGASIGIALAPSDGTDADALIRHAGHAMRSAKRAGGNCFRLFDPEQEHRLSKTREVLGRVRHALMRGEFELFYQPQVNLRRGEIAGAEALLRWRDPLSGVIAPGEFLPYIEESDFMLSLGEWVLERALSQLSAWIAEGIRVKIGINIAAKQLLAPDFIERLEAALARHPTVPAELLELEILETTVLEDMDHVQRIVQHGGTIGIDFALDDFGTGYASLSHLRDLPARILKIDQSFVGKMLDDPSNLAIIEAIIGLTSAFQRQTIAEGVETAEQGLLLLRLGCDVMQGYVYGQPMPANEFQHWYTAFQPDPEWIQAANDHIQREEFPLLAAEIQHRNWIDQFTNLNVGESITLHRAEIENEHRCAVGRWYFGAGRARFEHLPSFSKLGEAHRRIHEAGVNLAKLHENGRSAVYQQCLPEFERLSRQFIALLHQLRMEVRNATAQKVSEV